MLTLSKRMNVLVSLYPGYGLGDGVQMSSVLRHLVKHRPHWDIDYRADEGKHQVGRGLVVNHFAHKEPFPSSHYDAEAEIRLFDTWAGWHDRPNTRVTSCLHEVFGLDWDAACGEYHIAVRKDSITAARTLLANDKCVAVHYQGDSAQVRKNLSHRQADAICRVIIKLGYEPILLDWRSTSILEHRKLRTPQGWGSDAEMVAAVVSQCAAFIGIDSGPSKCASATNTPTLVVWTGHHPAAFHDPAQNTTHLVHVSHHSLHPVCNDSAVIRWFEDHYHIMQYANDPICRIVEWLKGALEL